MLGFGSEDVFYLDKIDKGVKKYVTDKDRKKELQVELKTYSKAVEQFGKITKSHLKELKKKNIDNNTSKQWYVDFFGQRMEERRELQALFITERFNLQQKITDDEWAEIMKMATDEASKVEAKEQKKEMKQKDKNFFESQEKVMNEEILDQDKRSKVLEALKVYEEKYDETHNTYEHINANETDFLTDKNATKEDMQKFADALNKLNIKMYQAYLDFFMILKENTNDEEWASIIKVFNKEVK